MLEMARKKQVVTLLSLAQETTVEGGSREEKGDREGLFPGPGWSLNVLMWPWILNKDLLSQGRAFTHTPFSLGINLLRLATCHRRRLVFIFVPENSARFPP